MVRLLGPFSEKSFSEGQRLDVYVDQVYSGQGRLLLSLTPVYRRPSVDEQGQPLPLYKLQELTIGMYVSVSTHTKIYAYIYIYI